MLIKEMKISSNKLIVENLNELNNKIIEVIIIEKNKNILNNKMKHFFKLAGKIDIDNKKIDKLREKSIIRGE